MLDEVKFIDTSSLSNCTMGPNPISRYFFLLFQYHKSKADTVCWVAYIDVVQKTTTSWYFLFLLIKINPYKNPFGRLESELILIMNFHAVVVHILNEISNFVQKSFFNIYEALGLCYFWLCRRIQIQCLEKDMTPLCTPQPTEVGQYKNNSCTLKPKTEFSFN